MSFADKVFNLLKWDISKFIIVPLLAMLLFIILINEIIMPSYTRHGQAVEVPDVVNMTYESARTLIDRSDLTIVEQAKKGDVLLIMSNGSFDNLPDRLLKKIGNL